MPHKFERTLRSRSKNGEASISVDFALNDLHILPSLLSHSSIVRISTLHGFAMITAVILQSFDDMVSVLQEATQHLVVAFPLRFLFFFPVGRTRISIVEAYRLGLGTWLTWSRFVMCSETLRKFLNWFSWR